ncbi:MAG TPA: hypothetical protein VFV65_08425 [Gemmatimonadales bacterium]|nr:hypothetical protein [Gemmatimonadales bacterium]
MSAGPLRVRVTVQDTWDTAELSLPADSSVAELKLRALVLNHVPDDPSGYEVKYRGASLRDETLSLAAAQVVDNAALIVLPVRRRPVK